MLAEMNFFVANRLYTIWNLVIFKRTNIVHYIVLINTMEGKFGQYLSSRVLGDKVKNVSGTKC